MMHSNDITQTKIPTHDEKNPMEEEDKKIPSKSIDSCLQKKPNERRRKENIQ